MIWKFVRTIILLVLVMFIIYAQPPFYAGEYKDYLPNLDRKIMQTPIGEYYAQIKLLLSNYLVELTYRKVLVLNTIVDENCVINMNNKQYYLAPIECNDKVRETIESFWKTQKLSGKYIYFKKAANQNVYRDIFQLDSSVQVGYFWTDRPNVSNLQENNINMIVSLSSKAKLKPINEDNIWKEIYGVSQ